MKHITALAPLLLAAGIVLTSVQNSDQELQSELIRVYTDWYSAFDKGDGAAMDRLEVSNFHAVYPDGTVWKKTKPRAGVQQPTTYTSRTLSDVDVRQFGDAAVLTGTLTSAPGLTSAPEKVGTTVVFSRQGGNWLVASGQWSVTKGSEDAVNRAGYILLESGKVSEAIELLKVNVKLNPNSWNAYDSLGEAYVKAGNTELARQSYDKSVQLNPHNEAGIAALKKLKGK